MIKKLQKKFIIIAMVAITLVIIGIAGMINIVYIIRTNSETDFLLNFIASNDGVFPEYKSNNNNKDIITQESEHSSRYFSIKIDANGNIIDFNLEHIITVREDQIGKMIESINLDNESEGYYYNYKYLVVEKEEYKLVVFLDCMSYIQSRNFILKNSIIVSAIAVGVIFILLSIFSKKAIKPLIQNVEKQKQFITNAGHELKTPVAIILANAEVLEIKNGESDEWTQSIKKQAERLDYLIKKLLRLSKMYEKDMKVNFQEENISELIESVANSIEIIAKDKNIEKEIEKNVILNCDKESIYELISILLDNAIKYVSKDGKIKITLIKQCKNIRVDISNNCDNINSEDCERLFERFYRKDNSRNNKTGGYGIGLSMADAIVKMHKGKIEAKYIDGVIHFIILFNT